MKVKILFHFAYYDPDTLTPAGVYFSGSTLSHCLDEFIKKIPEKNIVGITVVPDHLRESLQPVIVEL